MPYFVLLKFLLSCVVLQTIFLKNLHKLRHQRFGDIAEVDILSELSPGEQLCEEDIEKAMNDPDIRPKALHASDGAIDPPVQLYFGPGFEERLELELEE